MVASKSTSQCSSMHLGLSARPCVLLLLKLYVANPGLLKLKMSEGSLRAHNHCLDNCFFSHINNINTRLDVRLVNLIYNKNLRFLIFLGYLQLN